MHPSWRDDEEFIYVTTDTAEVLFTHNSYYCSM